METPGTPSPIGPEDEAPTVALVAYDALGDGLVYLMMAENLRLAGFRVTYYGSCLFPLAGWFPQLPMRPYPATDALEAELGRHDLVLYSPPSFVRHHAPAAELRRLAERYVVICLSRNLPEAWRVDHTARLARLPAGKRARLQRLAACSGRIRHRHFSRESVVEIALSFLQEKMGLEHVTPQVRMRVPAGLRHRRYRDRIAICPDSAVPERKDLRPARVLALAAALKARRLQPAIVASPCNIARWGQLADGVCDTPALRSVDALAAYLYESGVVVASDSGSGHLASCLRVPTVTIHRRMNRRFAWRPGWGPGVVVCPWITLSLGKRHLWRPFLTTASVLRAVEAMHAVRE